MPIQARRPDINANLDAAVAAALDKKAEGVTILDLTALGSITDYFMVCHGRSARQVQAIADSIEARLKQDGVRPGHLEGYDSGEWILMDYVDFVIHVFSDEKRRFYDLEKLWSDAPKSRHGETGAARRRGGE